MEFYRGDRINWAYAYIVGGVVTGITDYIFTFTISSEQNPTDNSTQIFQSIGVITDAANGKLTFLITTDINPATYYYDIQVEKPSGNIRTLDKGKFKVIQDITKSGLDNGITTEDDDLFWTEDHLALTEG